MGDITTTTPNGLTPRHGLKPRASCVIPAYNESSNLPVVIPRIVETLWPLVSSLEIIVVDDGSRDHTTATAIGLSQQYPVKVLQFSRNFGKECAITAGLDHARGDVVFLLDADGQHPIELLPTFLAHWQEGYDMIYGLRHDRSDESPLKRYLTSTFYRMLGGSASVEIVPDAGDFRLFDAKVVQALMSLPEKTRFMKGLYAWVGFSSKGIPFEVQERVSGRSHYNFKRLLSLALTGLFSFTDLPLRLSSALGILVSLFSVIYGAYITLRTLIFGVDQPGWATLTVALTFLGGLQLLSIGILGEYVGRIFNEVKGRPNYVIGRRVGFEETPAALRETTTPE